MIKYKISDVEDTSIKTHTYRLLDALDFYLVDIVEIECDYEVWVSIRRTGSRMSDKKRMFIIPMSTVDGDITKLKSMIEANLYKTISKLK